jgi:Uma2 family endonuclease
MQPRPYRWDRYSYERMAEAGVFPPQAHAELIDGEIVEMSPEGTLHYTVLSLPEHALRQAFGPGRLVRTQAPFVIDDDSEPEPDIAVVPGSPRDYLLAHPRRALLLVEIADSTLEYDRDVKSALYARAENPEYWLVNLQERRVEVFRDPHNGCYTRVETYGPDDAIKPLSADSALPVSQFLP